MTQINLTPLSQITDEVFGPIGTPERDEMEARLKADLDAYFLGEAIKKAREAQNLTQEELGERIGVQKSQISRLEKGRKLVTIPTLRKVFTALGISGTLDLGEAGRVALW